VGISKSSIRPCGPHTSAVLFVERMSGGPHAYIDAKNSGVRPLDLTYVYPIGLMFGFYFLRD
jgi:hypothetical protein